MAASRSGRFVVASSCPTTEEQREVPQFRMRPTNSPAPAAPAPPPVYYTAVVCQGGSFAVLRVDTGEILREIAAHDGEVRSLAISADERHVITGGADKKVRLWDVADITGAR